MSMSSSNNPLDTAKRLGNSLGGALAEEAFVELELAFVDKLFPKKFNDVPTLRTRQHILLYWRRGFLKTTIFDVFSDLKKKCSGIKKELSDQLGGRLTALGA